MSAVALAPLEEEVAAPPAAPQQENVVLPPLRKDLIVTKQVYEGRDYYVVKDPISLQYFRMTAEDYSLATLFDGIRTFGQIRQRYRERYPHVDLDYSPEDLNERILRFANDLAMLQFLSVQGMRLKARYDAAKQRKVKKNFLYNLANQVFFFRFSLFDPDKIFARMARPLWWIWTRPVMWASLAIMVAGLIVFIQNAQNLDQALANLFHWENLALMWVSTILLKSVHELGHGLTCKHFGGEVHEVGFMSMVFTPYFFVNVSDTWTMPNRRHRILVSAAGIYVELIFAALATFLWAVIQPGWFHNFLFNIIIITSVSTIMFNANPLMRFDGYYILTDWIEVPNLQGKARALIQHQFNLLLFGHSAKDATLSRMPLPKRRFALFYTYAVLSWLYGYWVIYKLIIFMKPHLEPLGLEGLSDWFAGLALTSWVLLPIFAFFKTMQLTRQDWKPHGRLRRLSAITAVAVGIFAVACFLPVELKIKRTGAVELAEPEQVRPEVPGFIQEVCVKEGDRVVPGQALVKMANRDLSQSLAMMENRLRVAEANVARAIGTEKPAELKQAENVRLAYEAKLHEAQRDVNNLVLKARTAGTVLTRELDRKTGHMLRGNELVCEIASLDPMRIKVALNEKEVRYVKKGQKVDLKVNAYPSRTFHGVIAEDPIIFFGESIPAAFSARRAGDVPVFVDAKGRDVPLERTFQAVVEVDNHEGLLRPGMTSRGKIHTGTRLWGQLVLQSLRDAISLDYRF
ncbi:MAG: putative peptide zinc metalloprotease protein [Chthoniobacteraceae bacterium]|nr:putative peptide zinc metalloprotease protein [Chthoniobacteraceae bacterium]